MPEPPTGETVVLGGGDSDNPPHERLEKFMRDAILVLGVPLGRGVERREMMEEPTARQARLTMLIGEMATAGHPHAALRLLQVCGVRRYQHYLRGLPPEQSDDSETLRVADELVRNTLLGILREPAIDVQTQARRDPLDRACLPTRMGGLNLPRMAEEAQGAHLAAFAAAAEDLHGRLCALPNNRTAEKVARLVQQVPEEVEWGAAVRGAWEAVQPLLALSDSDRQLLRKAAPEGPPAIRTGVRINSARPARRNRRDRPEYIYPDTYADIAALEVPAVEELALRRVPKLQAKLGRAAGPRRARHILNTPSEKKAQEIAAWMAATLNVECEATHSQRNAATTKKTCQSWNGHWCWALLGRIEDVLALVFERDSPAYETHLDMWEAFIDLMAVWYITDVQPTAWEVLAACVDSKGAAWLRAFLQVGSAEDVMPTMHTIVCHYGDMIRRHGPLLPYSSEGLEAKHQPLKRGGKFKTNRRAAGPKNT